MLLSDIPPRGYITGVIDMGTVLTIKIEIPIPGVREWGGLWHKGANKGGDFDKRNCQMSKSSGSALEGPWGFTLSGASNKSGLH